LCMDKERRYFISGAAAAVAGCMFQASASEAAEMYGLIGSVTAVPGRRDDLIAILVDAVSDMPGCLSYVVAKDTADADTLWITEVWDGKASHDASLSLPSVQKAITAGRPMIKGAGSRVVTTPVRIWRAEAHRRLKPAPRNRK
jgi:quinol monooxygenase YgiN